MTAVIVLSWPPQPLWPNRSRGRAWQARRAAEEAYTTEASVRAYEARDALRGITTPKLRVAFHKSTAGRFDLDNAHAAIKCAQDAIFGLWGKDDAIVSEVTLVRCEPVKGGRVVITITEAGE